MRTVFFICCTLLSAGVYAWPRIPKERTWSLSLSTQATATPFGRFARLLAGPIHPGADLGVGVDWRKGPRFTLYQQAGVGYFYHRFVQHGITLYTTLGYRGRIINGLDGMAGLSAGYLQAIPATAVLRADDQGNYASGKGAGRPQGLIGLTLGLRWTPRPSGNLHVLLAYKQRLQTPFVRSYVPLLPYNVLEIGIAKTVGK